MDSADKDKQDILIKEKHEKILAERQEFKIKDNDATNTTL